MGSSVSNSYEVILTIQLLLLSLFYGLQVHLFNISVSNIHRNTFSIYFIYMKSNIYTSSTLNRNTTRLTHSGEKILHGLTAWPCLVLIVTGVDWGLSAREFGISGPGSVSPVAPADHCGLCDLGSTTSVGCSTTRTSFSQLSGCLGPSEGFMSSAYTVNGLLLPFSWMLYSK